MDRDEALFVNLVMIFKSAAMQQMGKVINPLTGKVERNLEQARFSIDTIAMLKDKTSGNVTADLEKLLDSVLLELRMNFVEETRVGDTPPEAPEGGTAAAPEAGDEDLAAGQGEVGADSGQGDAQDGDKAE
jgi:hypothetical protein